MDPKEEKQTNNFEAPDAWYFSQGFEAFLNRSKLKQVDICKQIGVSSPVVSSWKNGLKVPGYFDLIALYELGMTPNEIFGFNSNAIKEKLAKIEALTKENQELKKQLEAAQKSEIASEKIALALGDIVKRLEALEAVKK